MTLPVGQEEYEKLIHNWPGEYKLKFPLWVQSNELTFNFQVISDFSATRSFVSWLVGWLVGWLIVFWLFYILTHEKLKCSILTFQLKYYLDKLLTSIGSLVSPFLYTQFFSSYECLVVREAPNNSDTEILSEALWETKSIHRKKWIDLTRILW